MISSVSLGSPTAMTSAKWKSTRRRSDMPAIPTGQHNTYAGAARPSQEVLRQEGGRVRSRDYVWLYWNHATHPGNWNRRSCSSMPTMIVGCSCDTSLEIFTRASAHTSARSETFCGPSIVAHDLTGPNYRPPYPVWGGDEKVTQLQKLSAIPRRTFMPNLRRTLFSEHGLLFSRFSGPTNFIWP